MKAQTISFLGALVALNALSANAKHAHEVLGSLQHQHLHHARDARASPKEAGIAEEAPRLKKRGQCEFPSDAGLVAVTPDSQNGGFAMSPDQSCTPGNYCPIACPSGSMMAQWDPSATSYPSMSGGLYCDEDGNMQKPFPNNEYCMTGSTNVGVSDKTGQGIAFCQTVLPGNEAMLIPTQVNGFAQLAVPTTDYWLSTAAHYYVNPPGMSSDDVCCWATNQDNFGNWSPFVAGANTDSNGNTFVKFGWNPEYIDSSCAYSNQLPDFGVAIECDGNGCNGLPCGFDPSQNQINELVGQQSDGAGGASFCVVTVPQGVSANFVVTGGSGGSSGSSGSSSSSPSSTAAAQSNSPSPSPSPSVSPSVSPSAQASSSSPAVSSSPISSMVSSWSPHTSWSAANAQPSVTWAGNNFLQNSSLVQPTASGQQTSAGVTAIYTIINGSSSAITTLPGPTSTLLPVANAAGHDRVSVTAFAFAVLTAFMAAVL